MRFIDVALNRPIFSTFTYSLPEELDITPLPGMRVVVPFGKRKEIGYILDVNVTPPSGVEIKEVISLIDERPIIPQDVLKLIRWLAEYYVAPIGEVVSLAVPPLLRELPRQSLKRDFPHVSERLSQFLRSEKVELNEKQKRIAREITSLTTHKVSLIFGVTGSGKTEVYIKIIEEVLDKGKGAILLIPEISLAPQLAGRVMGYFGSVVSVYHSGLSSRERYLEWEKIRGGSSRIVVGTRSAIFSPIAELGVIIVDEEHDYAYKQEDSPRYNARDVAIMRGKIENIPVVLGSATPSLESFTNVKKGKYLYFELKERHLGKAPVVEIVDMRKEVRSTLLNPYLSVTLISAIAKTLEEGKQVILFLNRKGFAKFTICRSCGYISKCPNCSISLTYHKVTARLSCHYCGYHIPPLSTCPSCGGVDIDEVGAGTQMIEDVLASEFPYSRIVRLDRDFARTDKKKSEILGQMKSGEIDILIGTQMVTKGHDFPNVTLVGIILADQLIHFPDFRATERTFQLITQVSGRAGRGFHPGRVIIQTYSPSHISIVSAATGDIDGFVDKELEARRELNYPPYSRLVNIRVSGNVEERVVKAAHKIVSRMKDVCKTGFGEILGPAPAPIRMIRGKIRWQILVKCQSVSQLNKVACFLREELKERSRYGVEISVDVDPISTI